MIKAAEAWVTVLGVCMQLLIDPKGDYFLDVRYDDEGCGYLSLQAEEEDEGEEFGPRLANLGCGRAVQACEMDPHRPCMFPHYPVINL